MAAASSSSASLFGIREEQDQQGNLIQLQMPSMMPTCSSAAASSSQQLGSPTAVAAAPKKRRNQPGNPNPDAEVIALSPKSLLATNRFVCEVCTKGFQREQNLQLHRRGHNLPWKLKQKSTKEVRRKVYLCPEVTCIHHDPSRALGDLTGIKKHFCRKHGEKKWKCDKCSKRYAVQSDWKAHSKTCGTREYRCDCGTLFSRRDSFITHRAFCDALAQESARLPPGLNNIGLFANSNMGLGLSQVNHHHQLTSLTDQGPSSADLLHLGGASGGSSQFEHLIPSNPSSTFTRSPSSAFYLAGGSGSSAQDFQAEDPKPFHGMMQLPNTSSAAASLFNFGFFSNGGGGSSGGNNGNGGQVANSGFLIADQFNNVAAVSAGQEQMTLYAGNHLMGSGDHSGLYSTSVHTEPVLPQMSATALLQKAAQMGATTSSGGRGFAGITKMAGNNLRAQMENETSIQDLMNSLVNGNAGIFGGAAVGGGSGGGFEVFNRGLTEMNESKLHQNLSMGAASDGLTRDFLGVGSVLRGLGGGLSQREQHAMASSMDSELRSGSSGGARLSPFGGAGSLQ